MIYHEWKRWNQGTLTLLDIYLFNYLNFKRKRFDGGSVANYEKWAYSYIQVVSKFRLHSFLCFIFGSHNSSWLTNVPLGHLSENFKINFKFEISLSNFCIKLKLHNAYYSQFNFVIKHLNINHFTSKLKINFTN